MIHEFRSYYAAPGKLAALDKHLEVACRLFPKHGLSVLGAWTDEVGRGGRISYMWSCADEAARNAALLSFRGDAEWKAHMQEELRLHGDVVARVENQLLAATAYSPAPKLSGRIQEMRVYHAMPGRLPEVNARFANHTLRFFEKHGIGAVGFWTEVYGASNRLVYLVSFDSLAEREKRWGSFVSDPAWAAVRAETEKNGPIVEYIENRLLKPTKYA